jgi:hypothetical protein
MLALFLLDGTDDTLSYASITAGGKLSLQACQRFRLVGVYPDQHQLDEGQRRVQSRIAVGKLARDRLASGSAKAHFSTGNPKAMYTSDSLGFVPNGWHQVPDWATVLVCEEVKSIPAAQQLTNARPELENLSPGDLDDLLVASGPGPQPPHDPHQELGLGLAY